MLRLSWVHRSCHKSFYNFTNGGFDVEDKERSRQKKVYKDADFKGFLEEDSYQAQEKLALTLRMI